jgi:putative ABC transport system permease protein
VQDRYREVARKKYHAVTVDVQSMYETASMLVNLEVALVLVSLVGVLFLFGFILIGVVFTLRMTVRERTREIGTMRAIGMQRNDVRDSFLLETGLLALFSSVLGLAAAAAAMWGISKIKINAQDNPLGMLLVNNHIHFAPTLLGTVGYVALIVAIAVAAAWLPARRAAKLTAAEALRHYD